MIVSIFSDYSRFKQCEDIIHESIDMAQSTHSWMELLKLIVIRCNYLCFAVNDGEKDKNSLKNIANINQMICDILNNSSSQMPIICDLFLRFLEIELKLKFDQSVESGHLLIETTKKLIKFIKNNRAQNSNSKNTKSRKRKLNECDFEMRATKKFKLNDETEKMMKNEAKIEEIEDGDICFLIHFCSLLTLCWIVRNSAFEQPEFMNQIRQNLKKTLIPLLNATTNNVSNGNGTLCQHINWLNNIESLASIITSLFRCFESMHNGKMNEAQSLIIEVEDELHSNSKNSHFVDFGILNLKLLVWSISSHLNLLCDSKLNDTVIEIAKLMQKNDEIKLLLKANYCSKKLFCNQCKIKKIRKCLHTMKCQLSYLMNRRMR